MLNANAYRASHRPLKVVSGLLVLSGALLLNSAVHAAERNPTSPRVIQNPNVANAATDLNRIKPPPKPDFTILNVSNKHTNGPKGIIRYGSCKNDFRVVIKNRGKEYTYGDTVQGIKKKSVVGGQILVQLQQYKDGAVKASHNLFVNHLGKNEVKNIDFTSTNPGQFSTRGSYTMKATIIPCMKGSSTPNCKRFREKKTSNNTFSVDIFAGKSC